MADKKLQDLNNTRTSVIVGDKIAIGGADGFTYKANLTILRGYLLESGLTTSTIKAPQSAVVKAAIDAINTILTTDNASLDDFQKITDAIKAIQTTLSVNDAAYDTLQKIVDKLKVAETKLATIETDADVNVQSDWNETDNTNDAFINNKPTLGTASSKNVGTAIGDVQENGAILGNSQTVETDATGKFITDAKNTAYNANFGTGNTDVARGDASYLKADTYTQTEANALLATKEATANKGVANGYASLNGSGQVPASQLPSYVDDVEEYSNLASFPTTGEAGKIYIALDTNLTYRWGGSTYVKLNDVDLTNYFNKTTDTTDDITAGTAKFTTQADIDKLAGIEDNATADQTPSEIKTAYESNADTNAFTDSEKTNLSNQSGTNTGDETLTTIQTKRPLKTIESQSLEGAGNIDLTKADVGLANVNNTSDADKPVSTAQQTALNTKLAKASNLIDLPNRQTALNNLTDVANAGNEQALFKDTVTGNAIFKNLPGISSAAYASAFSTGLITSATTLTPLSGTDITNSLNQFTVGASSITCNKAGNYYIIVSALVEPQSTSSVAVTLLINNINKGQTRYDSTVAGTGYFVAVSLNSITSIANNQVIQVSKNNATDNWKAIFISIVEII